MSNFVVESRRTMYAEMVHQPIHWGALRVTDKINSFLQGNDGRREITVAPCGKIWISDNLMGEAWTFSPVRPIPVAA